MLRPRRAAAMLLAVASAGTLALGGCGSSGGHSSSSGKSLTVWSEENDPQRMAEQRKVFAQFTAATRIKVDLVGVADWVVIGWSDLACWVFVASFSGLYTA